MPGMLTPDQMAALRKARGAEFDHLFLTGMIQHHKGALVMVKDLFNEPGAGQDADIFNFAAHRRPEHYRLIVERTGSDVWGFLLSHDILYRNRKNIVVIKQLIYNDISSTKVRYCFCENNLI